jgi:site-specific recombinase XerC
LPLWKSAVATIPGGSCQDLFKYNSGRRQTLYFIRTQNGWSATELPHAARDAGALARLVSLDDAQESHPAQSGFVLELPRLGHHLPKHVLSVEEVEQVLQQPGHVRADGTPHCAILETLYSSGTAKIQLKVYDTGLQGGTLFIRRG